MSPSAIPDHPALWRGASLAAAQDGHATGFARLDALLPGGGWPRGALAELLLDDAGIGELRLVLPALGAITAAGGWVAFVAPPYVPYAPALTGLGVDLSRLIVLKAEALKDQWWAAEQALRAGSLSAVLFWPTTLEERKLRRLQLAAQAGGSTGFVFAPAAHACQPSPAPLRLKLAAAGERLEVDILKRRGGPVAQPLLLDVGIRSESLLPPVVVPRQNRYAALHPRPRGAPRLGKRHANGGDSKRLWDQAIARGDPVAGSRG